METQNYYVIKPTRFDRKKVDLGEVLSLTESQSRPLRLGGFITPDRAAAERIMKRLKENAMLANKPGVKSKSDSDVSKADLDKNNESDPSTDKKGA